MSADDAFRLFGLNNLMIEQEVRRIEQEHDVDFGHRSNAIKNKDNEDYYPQFPAKLREEARQMAIHYQIFYCLKNDIGLHPVWMTPT
jgi:hypothetical protein